MCHVVTFQLQYSSSCNYCSSLIPIWIHLGSVSPRQNRHDCYLWRSILSTLDFLDIDPHSTIRLLFSVFHHNTFKSHPCFPHIIYSLYFWMLLYSNSNAHRGQNGEFCAPMVSLVKTITCEMKNIPSFIECGPQLGRKKKKQNTWTFLKFMHFILKTFS